MDGENNGKPNPIILIDDLGVKKPLFLVQHPPKVPFPLRKMLLSLRRVRLRGESLWPRVLNTTTKSVGWI